MTERSRIARARTPLRAAVAAVAAAAALSTAVSGATHATAAPAAPAAPASGLQAQFAAAAKEFKVPESILLAVSYQQTRWESHQGRPSTTGNYNVMGLTQVDLAAVAAAQAAAEPEVDQRGEGTPSAAARAVPAPAPPVDSPALHTLDAAAGLIGRPAAELRESTLQSIRGGAALLAEQQRRAKAPQSGDPAAWYGAVVGFSNGGSAEQGSTEGREFADRVFGTLGVGATRTTTDGQRLTLAPDPTAAAHSPAADRGTGVPGQQSPAQEAPGGSLAAPAAPPAAPSATAADPIECPSNLSCDFRPAAYAQNSADVTNFGNYSIANRGGAEIDYIVIHDTEGGYAGSLATFQNPATLASAHYLLRSSDGLVTQMVANKNVAWHAGNKTLNMHSVGIEHEGFALNGASWYSEQLYQSSATLTRYLADRFGVPLDREHIIGHDEVPGPIQSSVNGMHWDPGTFWDWNHYMDLVGGRAAPDQAYVIGGRITINPPFSNAYRPVVNNAPAQPANFVYLYSSPGGPLIGTGTQNASDWTDKAVAGGSYVVADLQGQWTAIWYNGRKAWFWNDGSSAVADNRPGQYVLTPKAGLSSVAVYGRSYPEYAAFSAAGVPAPDPNIVALDYTLPAGQRYVPASTTPVSGDFYYNPTINGTAANDRTWVTGSAVRYYPIRYNHRLAYVSADDVDLVPAPTDVLAGGERVQLLAQTANGPVNAGANYTRGVWEKYHAIPTVSGAADPNQSFSLLYMGSQLHAVTVANGHVHTADRNLNTGEWSPWYDLQVAGLAGPLTSSVTEVTVAATGSTMHVVVVAGGRLLEATADYAAGRWNQWGDISGVLNLPTGALNRIAASANGNVMHINGVGTDGRIHVADADYNRGVWAYGDITSAVGPLSGTITGLATVAVGSKQQLLVLVDGKVKQATADYAAGSWYGWGDISAITGQTTPLTKLSVTYTGNSLRLFGVGGGRILNANGDYAAGAWSGWMDTQSPGAAGPIAQVNTVAVAGI
ncbi:N-acetylmuramoyl-L-alanine amidase [Kitasatospora purpeofusca]|uniref:N-acetylmuramoyl-L-alanine amidase n=1 Tax=Kitasatospora purpeofusca TaxID=67352 RepID=UPI0036C49EF9